MLTATLIILSVLLAIQTVRMWAYRWRSRQAQQRLTATQAELEKAVSANWKLQTRLNSKVAGEQYARKHCDEWPDTII